jgi:hypothetical protein
MQTCHLKKLLEVVLGRSRMPFEVALGSHYETPARVIDFFSIIVVAGHCGKATRSVLLPLLAALSVFPTALDGGLVGMARPLQAVVPSLPRMETTPTASSSEACRVTMLSSSLVVFGYS